MCALGVFLGFGFAMFYQNQIQALISLGGVFGFLTWLVTPSDVLSFIKNWIRERKRTPTFTIKYDDKGNPDQYTPYATRLRNIANEGGKWEGARWKVLRINVKNDSDGMAPNCRARLQVVKTDNKGFPTTEKKYLRWVKENKTSMNLGAHIDEFLNVVFSIENGIYGVNAFVAQPESINEGNIPRQRDGFKKGSHIVSIQIDTETGQSIEKKFRIDVTDNWEELSMSMIES